MDTKEEPRWQRRYEARLPCRKVTTRRVISALTRDELMLMLAFHQHGNWGNVSDEQWAANDSAVEQGGNIVSVYQPRPEVSLHVVTTWKPRQFPKGCITKAFLPEDRTRKNLRFVRVPPYDW